ncbi:MAG: PDDEXK nuclease domain-containing protein, partial [Flavobacterium sp.]|uniref:PDDEXK nuclease domain-containing protein n=1 Tax=Flavobacterium sp. TaxID=239 RepID=UPI003267B5DF
MQLQNQFDEITTLIKTARSKAFYEVNRTVIELYWEIGKYISKKAEDDGWGKNIVEELAKHLENQVADTAGFSPRNLWRMKQFYETYKDIQILSPLVTEISWSNNLLIISGTKSLEEKEFYLRLAIRERYSKRELERQLGSGLYERVMLAKAGNFPEVLPGKDLREYGFRDHYLLEFLHLPDDHSEKDLRKNILKNLRDFILEFGKDFILVGEEYPVQVGKEDYYIDLLFFHRELCCLVPFDLKIDRFKPDYLGKMNFYLEVLDRELKKPHENPSVGVILCKEKDDEIVEIALSRSLSPTLIAAYET